MPLKVYDHAGSNVAAIRAEVDRVTINHGKPSLVIVDYIGLMTAPGIKETLQKFEQITAGLKTLAMEHEIPVIQLAQINRDALEANDAFLVLLGYSRDELL